MNPAAVRQSSFYITGGTVSSGGLLRHPDDDEELYDGLRQSRRWDDRLDSLAANP